MVIFTIQNNNKGKKILTLFYLKYVLFVYFNVICNMTEHSINVICPVALFTSYE